LFSRRVAWRQFREARKFSSLPKKRANNSICIRFSSGRYKSLSAKCSTRLPLLSQLRTQMPIGCFAKHQRAATPSPAISISHFNRPMMDIGSHKALLIDDARALISATIILEAIAVSIQGAECVTRDRRQDHWLIIGEARQQRQRRSWVNCPIRAGSQEHSPG
jgi:hypothetical protein